MVKIPRRKPSQSRWISSFALNYYKRREGELMRLTKKELVKKLISERREADDKLKTENTKLKAQLEFARSLLPKPREAPDWDDD